MVDLLPRTSLIHKAGPDIDVSQIHVARAETDWSHAYMNSQNQFVARKWFPVFAATQITGIVYKWRKDTWYRRWAGKWQPGTTPDQARMALDSPLAYQLDWTAVQYPLPSHLMGVADPGINLDRASTELVTNTLMMEQEIVIAEKFFKAGVWGLDYSGVDEEAEVDPATKKFLQFDKIGSQPREVFKALKIALDRKAMEPNLCVMSKPVFETLRVHPELLNWFASYATPGIALSELTEDIVARALGLPKIVVAGAKYATSEENVAVADIVLDYIFDSQGIWLGHIDEPGLMSANSGMLVSRNFDMDVPGGVDLAIERVPDLEKHVELVQGFQCYQPVLVGPDLGLFMDNAISAEAAAGTAY
jgi:hypothetical protein